MASEQSRTANPSPTEDVRPGLHRQTIHIPLIFLATALLCPWTFSWAAFGLYISSVLIFGLALSVGFHRYLTHKAFICHPGLRPVLLLVATLAFQCPGLQWAAVHRIHHRHADDKLDPHSPTHGWWQGFILWLVFPRREFAEFTYYQQHVADLTKDKYLLFLERHFHLLNVGYLLLLGAIGGAIFAGTDETFSWFSAISWLSWGGLARTTHINLITYLVNVLGHGHGTAAYRTGDRSTNLGLFLGLNTLGEGWHNNHHAFPRSARVGLHKWQWDLGWYLISFWRKLGLVSDVNVPQNEDIQRNNDAAA